MKKKLLSTLLILLMIIPCSACSDDYPEVKLTKVFDYVFDAGTFTQLDYDYADAYFKRNYDNWGDGGCSAIAKTLDNGDTIVGRNMDLNISNKPAYIFRTDVKGYYKTINLAYTFRKVSPDYNEILKSGVPDDLARVLPFMADDVLNEKGLYIEVNMRNGEAWPTGDSKFSCGGTNPSSDKRVYMFELPRYIGENCATVDEAVEYVKTLDVYSEDGYWNYCFLLADETGHYGVLEFACDEIFFHDYQPCQTNFYIEPILNQFEELKCGVGRYNLLMDNIDDVKSEEDMFNLMNRVCYSQVYDPYNSEFDVRSENVGVLFFATYDFLMAEENREYLYKAFDSIGSIVRNMDRQEQQDINMYWESSFTEVVNCNERSIFVRFFENNDKKVKITFDENIIIND